MTNCSGTQTNQAVLKLISKSKENIIGYLHTLFLGQKYNHIPMQISFWTNYQCLLNMTIYRFLPVFACLKSTERKPAHAPTKVLLRGSMVVPLCVRANLLATEVHKDFLGQCFVQYIYTHIALEVTQLLSEKFWRKRGWSRLQAEERHASPLLHCPAKPYSLAVSTSDNVLSHQQ